MAMYDAAGVQKMKHSTDFRQLIQDLFDVPLRGSLKNIHAGRKLTHYIGSLATFHYAEIHEMYEVGMFETAQEGEFLTQTRQSTCPAPFGQRPERDEGFLLSQISAQVGTTQFPAPQKPLNPITIVNCRPGFQACSYHRSLTA